MIGKIEIDEARKKRIIDKAGRLADEYGQKMGSCSNCTFEAIVNAFRCEGIELMTPEMQEAIFPGFLGLHGGMGMTGVSTCGAVSAAMFLISHVVDITKEDISKDPIVSLAACIPGVTYVIDRFEETYGAIDCLRLRYNRIQRAFDFLDPDAGLEGLLFASYQPEKCGMRAANFEGGRDQLPPTVGARWAAEAICDLLVMEPEERKKLPPHLRGTGPVEMESKIQKVIEIMKEVDFGRPMEKLSYRDLWTFKTKGKKGLEEKRLGSVRAPKEEHGAS